MAGSFEGEIDQETAAQIVDEIKEKLAAAMQGEAPRQFRSWGDRDHRSTIDNRLGQNAVSIRQSSTDSSDSL